MKNRIVRCAASAAVGVFPFEPAIIQVVAGEPVTADFTAPAAGEYEIACSEFCGRGHAQMKAALVSMSATKTNRRHP